MPTLEEELIADDTAAELEALAFEEAAALELAKDELADLLFEPLDVVVLPLAADVVEEDVVVGLEVGVVELARIGLVVWKVEVLMAVSPALDAVEAERCVAALATELAFCVAELATARAAAVGILASTCTQTWGFSWSDKRRSGLCPLLQSLLLHLLPL